jgi:hypothetical protein
VVTVTNGCDSDQAVRPVRLKLLATVSSPCRGLRYCHRRCHYHPHHPCGSPLPITTHPVALRLSLTQMGSVVFDLRQARRSPVSL